MSIELSLDSVRESFCLDDDYEIRQWNGREFSWSDIPEMQSSVVRRIMEILAVGDSTSDLVAFKLAWLGSSAAKRPLVEKAFAHLIRTSEGWEIEEAGLRKKLSHGWKKSKEFVSGAWDKTCELAEKTCEVVNEVWEEYKTEIIVGAAILAAAAVVAAVTAATGGVGTEAAVAGSAVLIQSLAEGGDDKPPTSTATDSKKPAESVALQEAPSPILSSEAILTSIHPTTPKYEPIFPLTSQEVIHSILVPEEPIVLFSQRVDPESVYGRDYFNRAYAEFGLNRQNPTPPPVISSEPLKKSQNQQFTEMVMAKVNEARQPNYVEDLLARRKGNIQRDEFVQHVERCLETVRAPDYHEELAKRGLKGLYNKSFAEYMNRVLEEQIFEPEYKTARETVERLFRAAEERTPGNNYASTLACHKPAAPFREIPLLGYVDQRTVHFHCGINNTFGTVVEGGLRLNEALDRAFAVQPHQIHSASLVKGLTVVGLGKLASSFEPILTSGIDVEFLQGLQLPGALLHDTKIQTSIDYEVATLTQIAKNILETGNPNLKQLHVTFSNGGYVFKEALKELPKEYRETVVVITSGTTAIIEDDLACRVYNVIGDKDWPSHVCNGGDSGIQVAKERGCTILPISQKVTEPVLGGHYFIQSDYQDVISEIIESRVAVDYEIY